MSFHRYAIRRGCQLAAASFAILYLVTAALGAEPWTFRVKFTDAVRAEPFTGRVYVLLSRRAAQPRTGPEWFHTEPFLARDVVDLQPGEECELSPSAAGVLTFPRDFDGTRLGGCRAQAVVRFNPWERKLGTGPGNGFSDVLMLDGQPGEVALEVDQTHPDRPFQETEWTKLLSVRSTLLSSFHGHDVFLHAAVVLPRSYADQPERRYPTIFTIPGFGGTHFSERRNQPVDENNPGGVEFLRVMLDPSCPLGHHVFADSANNGPVGQTLITELIPEFDRRFRSVAEPGARFLTGHSSGGWSSLWLQVTYPEVFGGVWSTSPDPVDFRDFQRINLYRAGENMYVDPAGQRRPLGRAGGQVLIWYDDFAWMEHVAGPGGQLHSFEAVFSPRGADGKPQLIWNRETGAVDTEVTKAWEKYDIRLVLERNWTELGPKLAGKLHVFMGDQDTFYLEGATVLLKESLAKLESDAVVEIHAGRDHGSLLSRELLVRIRTEMAESFLRIYPEGALTGAHSR
jgi:hypothetical protein